MDLRRYRNSPPADHVELLPSNGLRRNALSRQADESQGVLGTLNNASPALDAGIRQRDGGLVDTAINDVAIFRANLPAHGSTLAGFSVELDMKPAVFVQPALVDRRVSRHVHADQEDQEEGRERPANKIPCSPPATYIVQSGKPRDEDQPDDKIPLD